MNDRDLTKEEMEAIHKDPYQFLKPKETAANERKWFWMMDYCKSAQIPPAQEWAWSRARRAWETKNE